MSEDLLLALAGVIVLGIGAQWLAWRLKLPSILLLLGLGFLAGPISGLFMEKPILDPDGLMGGLLVPFVSLAVALILYEGGLSLRFSELRVAGSVLLRLVTVGAAVTWLLGAWFAHLFLDLSPSLCVLLGAILVVTGPTVIIPLLREIRPKGRVGAIVKWEGIVIDPIGAMLAVIVFEIILLGGFEDVAQHAVEVIARTILLGGAIGVAAGLLFVYMLRAFWIPDFLESAVSLMLVVGVYIAADQIQSESGLLATTVMGITLANQRFADVRHIAEFKENLRVLLISSLFILLGARLDLKTLMEIGPISLVFLAALILIVRPISVLASTIGSSFTRNENIFLSLMAPRGIVAASVASVFALRLVEQGQHEDAHKIVPLTFMVIFGTVMFCSIIVPRTSRWLGVAEPSPQGVLIVGAPAWARALASALKKHGFRVLMVDTNRMNIAQARMEGIETYTGSILADHTLDELDLGGLGRLIAATPNDWVNVLAVQRFSRTFGRSGVYQLPPGERRDDDHEPHQHLHGRWLFNKNMTFNALSDRVKKGAVVKATPLTEEFTFEQYKDRYGEKAVPLFVITENKKLSITTDDVKTEPKPGQTLLSLVDADAVDSAAKPPQTDQSPSDEVKS